MEAIARIRNLRGSARKARLVLDIIRGKNVPEAQRILQFSKKRMAKDVAKLLNSAIANAKDPKDMAKAFSLAVEAGRIAYKAKLAQKRDTAIASSPLTGFLYE